MAFTETSLSRMKGVDPRLADLMHHLRGQGHNIQISEGLRDRARQQELFDQGASKTLNSKHLTGNAIDLHLRDPETGKAIWDESAYAPLGAAAKQYATDQGWGDDFTWGGDWGWDSVHFQTNGAPFAAAAGAASAAESGLPNLGPQQAGQPQQAGLDETRLVGYGDNGLGRMQQGLQGKLGLNNKRMKGAGSQLFSLGQDLLNGEYG